MSEELKIKEHEDRQLRNAAMQNKQYERNLLFKAKEVAIQYANGDIEKAELIYLWMIK